MRLQTVVCNLLSWKIGLTNKRLMIICQLFQSQLLSWSNNVRKNAMRGDCCLRRYGERLLLWWMTWNSKQILMFKGKKLVLWMNIIGFILFIRKKLERMKRDFNFRKYNFFSLMRNKEKYKMSIKKWKINLRKIGINWMRWEGLHNL